MAELTVTVRDPSGLHARPAAAFVKLAGSFECDVRLSNASRDPDTWANAKSILDVLTLGVGCGQVIRLRAHGPDARLALHALSKLVGLDPGEAAAAGP